MHACKAETRDYQVSSARTGDIDWRNKRPRGLQAVALPAVRGDAVVHAELQHLRARVQHRAAVTQARARHQPPALRQEDLSGMHAH